LGLAQSTEELSLQKAIEIALEANPEVLSARRGIDAASGRFWQGISPPPASLSWNFDYIPTGSKIDGYGERKIELSQSIDFPTTIVLKGSALSSETDAADADFRNSSLAVTLQVKEAYYGVLARQQKLRLAEENLVITEDFARKAEIRLNVGEGTHLERLTANMQRTQARNAVETARNDLRLASGQLSLTLGRGKEYAREDYILTDSLAYRSYPMALDSLVEEAHRANPMVQAAGFRADAASVNRTIAWSSILPSLFASYSWQTLSANTDLYGVAFGVSVPIWFLLDQRGRVEEAAAVSAQADLGLRATRNFVSLDVKNAYLEFTNDERQVQSYRSDLIPQAEEVYRSASTSYESGEITYIEFLQARQTLIFARSGYIDALYHYNSALARLEKAVGRRLGE
jgi:cobalt-zinc-cadmium efflux system outer membrane protein